MQCVVSMLIMSGKVKLDQVSLGERKDKTVEGVKFRLIKYGIEGDVR